MVRAIRFTTMPCRGYKHMLPIMVTATIISNHDGVNKIGCDHNVPMNGYAVHHGYRPGVVNGMVVTDG